MSSALGRLKGASVHMTDLDLPSVMSASQRDILHHSEEFFI